MQQWSMYPGSSWTLTVFTFTPSAEEALNAYEPILTPVVPAETFWVPKALFCDTVKLELTSVKEHR